MKRNPSNWYCYQDHEAIICLSIINNLLENYTCTQDISSYKDQIVSAFLIGLVLHFASILEEVISSEREIRVKLADSYHIPVVCNACF